MHPCEVNTTPYLAAAPDMMTTPQLLTDLETRLEYRFQDKRLLEKTLYHRSYVNEHPRHGLKDNERLEFLGDAVLNLVIAHLLMTRFPDRDEGDLSRIRSHLVNEQELAEIARAIFLGPAIRLGRGEAQSNGREKNSILSDALEAVIAAVYMDAGFPAAFAFIEGQFRSRIRNADLHSTGGDYKSRLQERVQLVKKIQPRYAVVEETGPDHDKTFTVRVQAGDLAAEGVGKSKKLAEQAAARAALRLAEEP